jgi:hypothetical protein
MQIPKRPREYAREIADFPVLSWGAEVDKRVPAELRELVKAHLRATHFIVTKGKKRHDQNTN